MGPGRLPGPRDSPVMLEWNLAPDLHKDIHIVTSIYLCDLHLDVGVNWGNRTG